MNSSQLFSKIGKELNISKYGTESDQIFYFRVIYSAIGFCMRTAIATHENNGIDVTSNISKASMHRRIGKTLESYLIIAPEVKALFYMEENSEPINTIRSTLLRVSDIVEVGFDSQLLLGDKKSIGVSSGYLIEKGLVTFPNKGFASGLSWITEKDGSANCDELFDVFNIPTKKCSEVLERKVFDSDWERLDDFEGYEYFDADRKKVFSSCWMNSIKFQEDRIYMARKQLNFGMYDYQLMKKTREGTFVKRFSEYDQNVEIRETQRILYALKEKSEGKIKIAVDKYKKYSVYYFWSKLPAAEDYLLRYIGWPIDGVDNKKNVFVVRNELTIIVEKIISNLGMTMEEKLHE